MIWVNVKEKLPEEDGRYLILTTFIYPCRSNDEIVRENIPFVSNYRKIKGWMSQHGDFEITHWMEIPKLPT